MMYDVGAFVTVCDRGNEIFCVYLWENKGYETTNIFG
jgi:hypothetical protein